MTIKQAGIEIDIDQNGNPGCFYWCPTCKAEEWCHVEWVQGARWGTNALVHRDCDTEICRYDINDNIFLPEGV